jgi:hypothetical protein
MNSQLIHYHKEFLSFLSKEIDFLEKLLTEPMNGRLTFSSSRSAKETADILQKFELPTKKEYSTL